VIIGKFNLRGSSSELVNKKTSIKCSPLKRHKLSFSSLTEIEEEKTNHLFKKTKFKRRNINDILFDFIDKINKTYFKNFVESPMQDAFKLHNEIFGRMKDIYLKYWNDKFQLDMALFEIDDESIYLIILDGAQHKSTLPLIRSLTLEYEKEIFKLNQVLNNRLRVLLDSQLSCEHNLEMNEFYDSVMGNIITLFK
jgi:hypothetical protein